MAPDLLPEFTISTKVGFFPGDRGRTSHQLTPELILHGVKTTVDDLGVVPSVVLLHNPEQSLIDLPTTHAYNRLSAACAALAEAKAAGLCGEWGISSWSPRPVLKALAQATPATVPRPDVVMVRAGLLVRADVLDEGDRLFQVLKVPRTGRWGMSPYGGIASDSVWTEINARAMLDGAPSCTPHQAAFRVAYELPAVHRVAVGTDNPEHLRELATATTFKVNHEQVSVYRTLLRDSAQVPHGVTEEIG